jgi:hypothetical protein
MRDIRQNREAFEKLNKDLKAEKKRTGEKIAMLGDRKKRMDAAKKAALDLWKI